MNTNVELISKLELYYKLFFRNVPLIIMIVIKFNTSARIKYNILRLKDTSHT